MILLGKFGLNGNDIIISEENKLGDYVKFENGFISVKQIGSQRAADLFYFSSKNSEGKYSGSVFDSVSKAFSISSKEGLKKSPSSDPEKLVVFYDEAVKELVISRDLFGLTPLFYFHQPGVFFAFSTHLTSLLLLPEVKAERNFINHNKISRYLTWMTDSLEHTPETFYSNIQSVLPGHTLVVSRYGIKTFPYLKLQPEKWTSLTGQHEIAEAFRHVFSKAVSKHINDNDVVGSLLSGGLDSSSVSSTIRHLYPHRTIHTFYGETYTPLTNEHHYAREVAEKIRSIHHVVEPSYKDIDQAILYTSLYGFPEQASLPSGFMGGIINSAHLQGCDVLLTGTDGDSIIGYGMDHLDQLVLEENWEELSLNLLKMAERKIPANAPSGWEYYSSDQKRIYRTKTYLTSKLVEKLRKRSFGQAFSILSNPELIPGLSGRTLCIELMIRILKHPFNPSTKLPTFLGSQFINNKALSDPIPGKLTSSLLQDLPTSYLPALEEVFYGQGMHINEEVFYLSEYYNIRLGHPFYDKELFELCMQIPDSVKFDEGRGRGQLRHAMKGILPESVRGRTDKGIFNTFARESVLRLCHQGQDFLSDNNPVWNLIDRAKFKKLYQQLSTDNQPRHVHNRAIYFVNRAIHLSIWLHQNRK